jgi:thymidylate kinase
VFTVAIVGSDGAGKTTISRRVAASLPFSVKTMYMGVNLEMHEPMLPTTRLVLEVKRALGKRPDMVAALSGVGSEPRAGARSRGVTAAVKSSVKIANWVAEEWFRQLIAWYHSKLRHRVVIFDRHFFADYYAYDVAPGAKRRPLASRVHGQILQRAYPKPDLFVYLDASPEVLLARKGEGTLEFLERRRREYLELRGVVRNFVVVDADRPADEVAEDVVRIITGFRETGNASEPDRLRA